MSMLQSNCVSPIEKRYRISKRLGNEIQLLKTKCSGTNDFDSRTNLLIEKYMKLIKKCERNNSQSNFPIYIKSQF